MKRIFYPRFSLENIFPRIKLKVLDNKVTIRTLGCSESYLRGENEMVYMPSTEGMDNAGVIITNNNIIKIKLIQDKQKIKDIFKNQMIEFDYLERDKLVKILGLNIFLWKHYDNIIEIHLKKIKVIIPKAGYRKQEIIEKKNVIIRFSVKNGEEIIKQFSK